ncbi:hypothetical protein ADL04_01370 [Streptomyces sp. NRRL B-3648]|nr:hypothetical protein ADL04_01370 [Streptomyces sp. NRRL B-3648]
MAHLSEEQLGAYLGGIGPGSALEHEGTRFTGALLGRVLDALRDPEDGRPRLGHANFTEAVFTEKADFRKAVFSGTVIFRRAGFEDEAMFTGSESVDDGTVLLHHARFKYADFTNYVGRFEAFSTEFSDTVRFDGAELRNGRLLEVACREASFRGAKFAGVTELDISVEREAAFDKAVFDGELQCKATIGGAADFHHARFAGRTTFQGTFMAGAFFRGAVFTGTTTFDQVNLHGPTSFREAVFEDVTTLGPLMCEGLLDLALARFDAPLVVEAAARRVNFRRARFGATATVRLRHASVDLTGASLEYPFGISAQRSTFAGPDSWVDESPLEGDGGVSLVSLTGVDAAHVMLSDIDLSDCRFIGAFHLDQLRLEGNCRFAMAPRGIHRRRWLPVRSTPRRTLAEEHHWRFADGATPWTPSRADQTRWEVLAPQEEHLARIGEENRAEHAAREAESGAAPGPPPPARSTTTTAGPTSPSPPAPEVRDPMAIGMVYQRLRKSFEDSGNASDAADFHYGEMEMRRHDRGRPPGERWLLRAYWALSGYGLRASRAIGSLLAAMAVIMLAMAVWGLPSHDPEPASKGTLAGRTFHMVTTTPDPQSPRGPVTERLTAERLEKAAEVVADAAIFQSSGQDLTDAGTYIVMGTRLAEFAMLGLGVLGFRGRIGR